MWSRLCDATDLALPGQQQDEGQQLFVPAHCHRSCDCWYKRRACTGEPPSAWQHPAMRATWQFQRPWCARVWHLTKVLHGAELRLPRSAAAATRPTELSAGVGQQAALRACKAVLPQRDRRQAIVGTALGACTLPVPTGLSRRRRMPQLHSREGGAEVGGTHQPAPANQPAGSGCQHALVSPPRHHQHQQQALQQRSHRRSRLACLLAR